MKNIFAILLCIAMMLSLVACAESQDNGQTVNNNQNNAQIENNSNNIETTPDEPTAEEWDAIDKYRVIMNALNDYAENGSIWIEYSDFGIESDKESVGDMDALAFCYDQLTKLDAVDKWVGTDYIDKAWVRQNALDSFVIIEDVLLSEKRIYEDHLGNVDNAASPECSWTYNTDGTVFSSTVPSLFDTSNEHPWMYRSFIEQVEGNPGGVNVGSPFFIYDADGNIEKIEYAYFAGDTINAVRKFTYNGDLISSEQIIFADGTEESISYTYDSNNRLTEITTILGLTRNHLKYVFAYEYNDRGQVVTEKVTVEQEDYWNENTYEFYREAITNYTYDSNGNLSSGVCKCTERWDNGKATTTDEWTYSCDGKGRPVSVNISCGDTIKETGDVARNEDLPVCNIEFEYGNYYIYTPAN